MPEQKAGKLTLERLGDTEIELKRFFQAPRDLVWRAYTEPELIAQWWAPGDATTEIKEMDVRPGGRWHYCMRGEWGESWGLMLYREVERPEHLSYTDVFSNEAGDSIPPEARGSTMLVEQDGGTMVVNRTSYASAEDLSKVIEMGVEEGTAMAMDNLEALLARLQS